MFASNAQRSWLPTRITDTIRFVSLVLVFTLVFLGGYAQAVATTSEYRLGAGDRLRITVFGHENMSGEASVTGEGMISLPFVGSLKSGGLTVSELERAIVARLKPDYLKNPRVSVEVLNFRPFDIIGEVQKPGSFPYRSGMTVINAVAIAGGFTYRAKTNEFRIKRAGSSQEVSANRDTAVMPGDVIEILERWF